MPRTGKSKRAVKRKAESQEAEVEVEESELSKRLQSDSKFFDDILSLINPKFYLHIDQEQDEVSDQKFIHHKKQKKTKLEVKENTAKAKKLKLDPDTKTIVEYQEELARNGNVIDKIEDPKERLQAKILALQSDRKHDADQVAARRIEKKNKDKLKKAKAKSKADAAKNPKIEVPERTMEKSKAKEEPSGFIQFNSMDFDEKKQKKTLDPKHQLQKIEAKKEKMKTFDSEKVESLKEKDSWTNAMERAKGVKIKDDPKLLKKSIKRAENAKLKSSKTWGDRQKTVRNDEKAKIAKRQKNIDKRIDSIKAKNRGTKIKGKKGSSDSKSKKTSKPKGKK